MVNIIYICILTMKVYSVISYYVSHHLTKHKRISWKNVTLIKNKRRIEIDKEKEGEIGFWLAYLFWFGFVLNWFWVIFCREYFWIPVFWKSEFWFVIILWFYFIYLFIWGNDYFEMCLPFVGTSRLWGIIWLWTPVIFNWHGLLQSMLLILLILFSKCLFGNSLLKAC